MVNKMNINVTENSQIFRNYNSSLISKTFKILPLYEERNDGLLRYVQSLIYELSGLLGVINSLNDNENFLSLLAVLNSIANDVIDFSNEKEVIKREVFKCIDLIKKISETTKAMEGTEM